MDRRNFILLATAASTSTLSVRSASAQKNKKTVDMVTKGGNYYFDPIGLYVEPGEEVVFRIQSGAHTSTSYKKGIGPSKTTRIPKKADGWNSGTLAKKGATFSHTFETKGTYDYYCVPHKSLGMVGRIVVGEPGGPAEGSMPPDGKVPKSEKIVRKGSISYSSFKSSDSKTSGTNSLQMEGGSSDLKTTIGFFGLLTGIAYVVYYTLNSEGEKYRIGSKEWKEENNIPNTNKGKKKIETEKTSKR